MQSVVLIAVPAAESLVGPWRRRGDPASQLGIPAHVTLPFPFVPDPDPGVVDELRRVFSQVEAFDLAFGRVDSFGDDVLWLAPDPADRVRDVTLALTGRWPDYPPYGGAFPDVTPHLTVIAHRDPGLHAAARAGIEPGLPVVGRATHASLFVRGEQGGWSSRAEFPLADQA